MSEVLIRRTVGIAAVLLVALPIAVMPGASALPPPSIDPAMVPTDGVPASETAMRQSNQCAEPIAAPEPNVDLPAPGFTNLNITEAWRYSTGHGVTVAVIDTGVSPVPRLPVIAGGDYVAGGDGLSDCDSHGTVVASVIAAAPAGVAMPRPMPVRPAFPSPGSNSVATSDGVEMSAGAVSTGDGVVGVAPHSSLISIRQSSRAFEPATLWSGDREQTRKAGTIATLARAVVHAANLGAKVINISVAACISPAENVDQRAIGAALWYAATTKDAVIVAAAGNAGEDGCAPNEEGKPLATISSPSWFSDYVLSVGAVDPSGAPITQSLSGPWVGVAAPGVSIIGLAPRTGRPVNAYPPDRAGEKSTPFWGTSFAAAYVSGVAALVRAKYPELSAAQVIQRIQRTAHNPPQGVDQKVGFGVVDPVAALTFDVSSGAEPETGGQARSVPPPAPSPLPDHRGRNVAAVFAGCVMVAALSAALVLRARRSR